MNHILHEFNNIHLKLQFTIEQEQDNRLNFLDLTFQITGNNLMYKSTENNSNIHNNT